MASKKGNFVGRFARGAALAAAIGASKPASATSTEQDQAAQMYRSQNSARNDAKLTINNEDEAVGLEIDNIQASLESGGNNSSSLETTPDGSAGVKLKLKFDVPSSTSTQPTSSAHQTKRSSPTQTQHNSTTDPSTPEAPLDSPTNDQGEGIEENPFPLADAESNPSSEQGTEEGNEGNEDESEEDQSAFLDQALQEEQVREQQLEQERGKKKQEVQKKRNVGMRILQQTQAQEMSMKQDQQMAQKLKRVMRIKQDLDRKIKMLELKKAPLKYPLRALQTAKALIIIARIFVILLAVVFYITIILFVIGSALMTFNRFLGVVQKGLTEKIKTLKNKIKKIDDEIDEAEKNRKKAIDVIQLIQKQKRTGPRARPPKFDVPQAA
ncbi:MAG: hypothetical protein KBD29_00320 [Candidatus Magasanikbacteria bacterium]|nr:hypothetical protein [Candidatus Magasanikbacteria bacterium]